MINNGTIINCMLLAIIGYMLYYFFYGKEKNDKIDECIDKLDTDNNLNSKLKNIFYDYNKDLDNNLDNNLDNELKLIFEKNNPKLQTTFSTNLNQFEGNSTLPKVYLNIKAGPKDLGQIIIKLFTNNVPKTCENFRILCSGERGYTRTGKKLSYKDSPFHRIIPGFMIQGGDIENGDGTGKMSIHGESFEDESFLIQHNKPGIVSMANSGPDSNGCQFFIITNPQPHLDRKHVAFGQVIHGMDIIKKLEEFGTEDGTPKTKVIISDCGLI